MQRRGQLEVELSTKLLTIIPAHEGVAEVGVVAALNGGANLLGEAQNKSHVMHREVIERLGVVIQLGRLEEGAQLAAANPRGTSRAVTMRCERGGVIDKLRPLQRKVAV